MKKGDEKVNGIYLYIKDCIQNNGYSPSVREIAQEFDIKSTSTVQYYLDKLRDSGLISHDYGKKRAVTITAPRPMANYVPLVGNVSAGTGILAFENIEGEYPLPREIFHGSDLFMLHVDGTSMINAGIDDGDIVVVSRQSIAEIGEIVVVFWQDKATVKRLRAMSPNLVLHPENDTMDDIVISQSDNPQILGKVVGCIKKF